MIKSTINCSENGCYDHVQKYKKLECLCWEEGESWDGEEEGEEEGEIEEESVGRVSIYWLLPMESPTDMFRLWVHRWLCHVSVRRSRFESLGHSDGKIIWKNPRHHTIATFQKNYIIRRWYGWYIPTDVFRRYIPTISSTGIVCRYIPTEVEKEIISVGKNYQRKNYVGNSVDFRWFSGSELYRLGLDGMLLLW